MSISTASLLLVGSTSRLAFFSPDSTTTTTTTSSSCLCFRNFCHRPKRLSFCTTLKVSLSDGAPKTQDHDHDQGSTIVPPPVTDDAIAIDRQTARISADWETARMYNKKGLIHEASVEAFNTGGLLVRFYSLLGFLPFPELGRSHTIKEPNKSIKEVASNLVGSFISIKVLKVDEVNRGLIFSEREALWSRFSEEVNVGDIFVARVFAVEEYGAFAQLRFADGSYHLGGLIHVSELSWDFVRDPRDIVKEGDDVKVKVLSVDRVKLRITLSMKQLEEDPLLETLEKVIPQVRSVDPSLAGSETIDIEPLPGLDSIIEELRQEDGISAVKITRQGFEKRVVSPDLQLWLSNTPSTGEQFTILARAGRQVQEILLSTSLDQEGIKRALQRVLERVP